MPRSCAGSFSTLFMNSSEAGEPASSADQSTGRDFPPVSPLNSCSSSVLNLCAFLFGLLFPVHSRAKSRPRQRPIHPAG